MEKINISIINWSKNNNSIAFYYWGPPHDGGEKRSRPLMTKDKNPDSTPRNKNIILGKL